MSTISFTLRPANKQNECPVSIKHTHKGSEFIKATGVAVPAKYINLKTGIVSKLPNAPELSATIAQVATDIRVAVRDLVAIGVEPTKAALSKQYDDLLTKRETAIRITPKINKIFSNQLEQLKFELQDLEQQVVDKKKEIERYEILTGTIETNLLAKSIRDYAEVNAETAAINTTRLYKNVGNVVEMYKPTWKITDVSPDTLAAFETYLISLGRKNLTITDTITKIKTVVYANAKKLNIDISDLRDHKTKVAAKSNTNVVYLKKNELQDLINLEGLTEAQDRIRDRFVLMCLTGIRYSDSNIKEDNIFNDELLFTTEKTDTDITIPLADDVKRILAKYNNTIPEYPAEDFNRGIKQVCKKVASLHYKVQIKEYKGKNKSTKLSKFKYDVISSHAGRKTFINLALQKGINPVAIAGIVGHTGTQLIMNTYGSKEAGKERIAQLLQD